MADLFAELKKALADGEIGPALLLELVESIQLQPAAEDDGIISLPGEVRDALTEVIKTVLEALPEGALHDNLSELAEKFGIVLGSGASGISENSQVQNFLPGAIDEAGIFVFDAPADAPDLNSAVAGWRGEDFDVLAFDADTRLVSLASDDTGDRPDKDQVTLPPSVFDLIA